MAESNSLRIMYFSNSIALGGMEAHLVDLAHTAMAHGHSVMAVVPTLPELDSQVAHLTSGGVRVERLNLAGAQSSAQLARAWLRLRDLVREFKPDIVHQHRTGPFHGKWAVLAARAGGARVVVATEHQPAYRLQGIKRWINRAADSFVNAIIVVSEFDRAQQLAFTDRSASQVFAIHNGIDLTRFTPPTRDEIAARRQTLGVPTDALVIGSLSRLDQQKGIRHFLNALPQVQGNWVALIAGDGPLRQELQKQAEQLGIASRVRFLGFCADQTHVLAAYDVFVQTSEWESFGLSPVEAMAMCKPVVLTRVGGMAELLVENETGAYVPPREPDALAAALNRVLSDPGLRERWGHAGRARVEKCFSVDAMTDKTIDVYRDLLGQVTR